MKAIIAGFGMCVLAISASPASASDYFKVTVTRKGDNLYLIDGTKFYVVTRYCYEYAYNEEAILKIDSPSGYTIGELIFTSGSSKCDVEKVLS